jgi:hypothetical protein
LGTEELMLPSMAELNAPLNALHVTVDSLHGASTRWRFTVPTPRFVYLFSVRVAELTFALAGSELRSKRSSDW